MEQLHRPNRLTLIPISCFPLLWLRTTSASLHAKFPSAVLECCLIHELCDPSIIHNVEDSLLFNSYDKMVACDLTLLLLYTRYSFSIPRDSWRFMCCVTYQHWWHTWGRWRQSVCYLLEQKWQDTDVLYSFTNHYLVPLVWRLTCWVFAMAGPSI